MKFETAIAMHLEIKRKLYYKSQMLQTGKWGKKKKKVIWINKQKKVNMITDRMQSVYFQGRLRKFSKD